MTDAQRAALRLVADDFADWVADFAAYNAKGTARLAHARDAVALLTLDALRSAKGACDCKPAPPVEEPKPEPKPVEEKPKPAPIVPFKRPRGRPRKNG